MNPFSPLKLCTYICCSIVVILVVLNLFLAYPAIIIAIGIGQILAYLNIISGFWVLNRYFKAENKLFFKAVFGGMFLRMLITLFIFAAILATTKIHKFSFTVSLVISYILYSVIEMIYIYKNLEINSDNY